MSNRILEGITNAMATVFNVFKARQARLPRLLNGSEADREFLPGLLWNYGLADNVRLTAHLDTDQERRAWTSGANTLWKTKGEHEVYRQVINRSVGARCHIHDWHNDAKALVQTAYNVNQGGPAHALAQQYAGGPGGIVPNPGPWGDFIAAQSTAVTAEGVILAGQNKWNGTPTDPGGGEWRTRILIEDRLGTLDKDAALDALRLVKPMGERLDVVFCPFLEDWTRGVGVGSTLSGLPARWTDSNTIYDARLWDLQGPLPLAGVYGSTPVPVYGVLFRSEDDPGLDANGLPLPASGHVFIAPNSLRGRAAGWQTAITSDWLYYSSVADADVASVALLDDVHYDSTFQIARAATNLTASFFFRMDPAANPSGSPQGYRVMIRPNDLADADTGVPPNNNPQPCINLMRRPSTLGVESTVATGTWECPSLENAMIMLASSVPYAASYDLLSRAAEIRMRVTTEPEGSGMRIKVFMNGTEVIDWFDAAPLPVGTLGWRAWPNQEIRVLNMEVVPNGPTVHTINP